MSGFKDMVEADLSAVFLDLDTFGEEYIIEGKKVAIVLDSDKLEELRSGQDLAVADSATLFYAIAEKLPPRRLPGATLQVNGRVCTIDAWSEVMGMATVVLHETITG